jgi:hypothetical protein
MFSIQKENSESGETVALRHQISQYLVAVYGTTQRNRFWDQIFPENSLILF